MSRSAREEERKIRRMLAWRERVFRRQPTASAWGPSYEAAIWAVPGEAPTGSSPSGFRYRPFQRLMHPLSLPEAVAHALALYNPSVWEAHDNHVLSPWPAENPLSTHPIYRSRPWPATRGTLQILDSLGVASSHPRVPRLTVAGAAVGQDGKPTRIEISDGNQVLPWIGDLLLFLKDEHGNVWLVEWDIKSESGKHAQPWAGDWRPGRNAAALAKAEIREAAYVPYMADMGIPIRRVAADQIPPVVGANLVRLCQRYAREVALPPTLITELIEAFRDALRTGELPMDAIGRLVRGHEEKQAATRVLDHCVWERRFAVDLWQPLTVDHPLRPERVDVLHHFSHLFARQPHVQPH